jgi:SAM-dependent methyltransferase
VLPRATEQSDAAVAGIAKHMFVELVCTRGRDFALKFLEERHPEWVPVCDAMDLDKIPTMLASEVAFAYDVAADTAREVGRGSKVDYRTIDLAPFEIPGRADLVGVGNDAAYVADLKTGWSSATNARRNGQLLFLALAACRVYDRDSAIVELIYARPDGSVWKDRAELDAFELDAFADRLRELPSRVAVAQKAIELNGEPNISQGPWCRYCPAFASCPAKTKLVRAIGDGSEIAALQKLQPLTQATAATAYHRLRSAKELLAKVESAVYAYARETPIDLGDGQLLGEVTREGNERLDGEIAYAVIREIHGVEIADAAVARSVTKKAIGEALRGKVPRLAPAEREVLDAIRAAGGSERPLRVVIEEYPRPTPATPKSDPGDERIAELTAPDYDGP